MRDRTDGIGPRVAGGTYRSGYWGETYTVEAIWLPLDGERWTMRVRWQGGHTTVHATAWDERRDRVVSTH